MPNTLPSTINNNIHINNNNNNNNNQNSNNNNNNNSNNSKIKIKSKSTSLLKINKKEPIDPEVELLRKKEEIRRAVISRRKRRAKLKNEEFNSEEENEKREKDEKQRKENRVYNYIILKGNNSMIIKKCMGYRTNWKELNDTSSPFFNLKWRPISSGRDYSNLLKSQTDHQMINHFEYHSCISNKLNLFQNVMKFCEVIIFIFISIFNL